MAIVPKETPWLIVNMPFKRSKMVRLDVRGKNLDKIEVFTSDSREGEDGTAAETIADLGGIDHTIQNFQLDKAFISKIKIRCSPIDGATVEIHECYIEILPEELLQTG